MEGFICCKERSVATEHNQNEKVIRTTTLREVVSRPQHTDTTQTEDDRQHERRVTLERRTQICLLVTILPAVCCWVLLLVFMTFAMVMTANFETLSLKCRCFVMTSK